MSQVAVKISQTCKNVIRILELIWRFLKYVLIRSYGWSQKCHISIIYINLIRWSVRILLTVTMLSWCFSYSCYSLDLILNFTGLLRSPRSHCPNRLDLLDLFLKLHQNAAFPILYVFGDFELHISSALCKMALCEYSPDFVSDTETFFLC